MKGLLTPKQVARALDVSESSIKRWCDKGTIATQYTAGGHRRIAIDALVDFVRINQHELVYPEALGLPPTSGKSERVIDRGRERMTEAMLAGDEDACRQIAIDLYLAEHSIAKISDCVFARSFQEIGDEWQCGTAEVYQERLGCEMMRRLLYDLRRIGGTPPADAPVAIGGTPSGDPYSLGTAVVELVLRDARFNAVSLGNDLPFETFAEAIRKSRPHLFWLSCSTIADEESFIEGYSKLYDEFGHDVSFVVGGRALHESLRSRMNFAAYCDNMQHLEGFAQSLIGAIEKSDTKN